MLPSLPLCAAPMLSPQQQTCDEDLRPTSFGSLQHHSRFRTPNGFGHLEDAQIDYTFQPTLIPAKPPYYALARCIISSSQVRPGVALKRYSLRPHPPCYLSLCHGHHGSSANHPLLSADALPSLTTTSY